MQKTFALLAAVALLAAAAQADAQQGSLGQRFRVQGQPYEIVRYVVLGNADGAAYELLLPVDHNERGGWWSGLDVFPVGPAPTECEEDPDAGGLAPVEAIGDYSARINRWGARFSLGQSYSPAWDANTPATVSAAAYWGSSANVSVRLDAATCVRFGLRWSNGDGVQDDDPDRGDNALALDHQPDAEALARVSRAPESLLRRVTIRRLN